MILGFILPFILTTVAMPFETFISSSRTVLGMIASWGLRSLAFLLRLAGNIGYYLGRMVVNVYDLIIFPALWLEGLIVRKLAAKTADAKSKADSTKKRKEPMNMLEEAAPCKETTD
jgi:hypothetical protein